MLALCTGGVLLGCGGRSHEQKSVRRPPAVIGGNCGDPLAGAFDFHFTGPTDNVRYVVPTDGGGFVGFRAREVVTFGPGEVVTSVSLDPLDGVLEAMWSPVQVSPYGNAILAAGSRRVAILDFASGAFATFEPPDDLDRLSFGFSDSGTFVWSSIGILTPEHSLDELVEVRRLDGELAFTLTPHEWDPLIPATDDRVVWREDYELVVTDFAENELRRVTTPGYVNYPYASADGTTLVAEMASSLMFVTELGTSVVELGATPRRRALSRSGTLAVFSTNTDDKWQIQQIRSGSIEQLRELDVVYLDGLDVTEGGLLLLAGEAADGRELVELRTWEGTLLFSCFEPMERVGFYPAGFSRDGSHAYLLFSDRLRVFPVPDY